MLVWTFFLVEVVLFRPDGFRSAYAIVRS
jgi:hypothetical protein